VAAHGVLFELVLDQALGLELRREPPRPALQVRRHVPPVTGAKLGDLLFQPSQLRTQMIPHPICTPHPSTLVTTGDGELIQAVDKYRRIYVNLSPAVSAKP
jgi:hypothetical protein